eukprot:TRINITY_DN5206_c0_g1_i2.p1 TRINITY_DN5206_c0_g1~~TRINITY_DN5206_c0_g1_i2.p1  ORF type:complete len:437 (+),score=109.47 TRINITY_DN5206_c0_g1_i2:56-1366(+)
MDSQLRKLERKMGRIGLSKSKSPTKPVLPKSSKLTQLKAKLVKPRNLPNSPNKTALLTTTSPAKTLKTRRQLLDDEAQRTRREKELREREEYALIEMVETDGRLSIGKNSIPTFKNMKVLSCFRRRELMGQGAYGTVHRITINKDHNLDWIPRCTNPDDDYCEFALKRVLQKSYRRTKTGVGEFEILLKARHPFVCEIYGLVQSANSVYCVMEAVKGFQLFRLTSYGEGVPEDAARFYSASLILTLHHLHSNHIIFRDLKPENVMVHRDGYVKLVDFGFAKVCDTRTTTCCGTSDFMSPELVKKTDHSVGVDWWALGVLIYDMICARAPFEAPSDAQRFQLIRTYAEDPERHPIIPLPSHISLSCSQFVRGLLEPNENKRLGCNGIQEVMDHPWFEGFDWENLKKKNPVGTATPPFIPLTSEDETYPSYRSSVDKS